MVLIDSNVLIDVFSNDPQWAQWSDKALTAASDSADLAINPIIYAEVSLGFDRIEDLEAALPPAIQRLDLPYEASFLAARAYRSYRRRGGARRSPLPNFFIGAHAAISGLTILTRDRRRYSSYFPTVGLIAPSSPQPD